MYINKKSPVPVYYQLKNIILKKIENGEFGVGDPIPSERDLSETLGISRMTVRQALSQLVTEGVLHREKGRGTFVSGTKFEQRNLMSFSDIVKKHGQIPSTRIVSFDKGEASHDIREMLELKEDELIYHIKRLRLANGIPIGIEEAFIPEKYCSNLEKFDLTSSLYELIHREYGYSIDYLDNVIEAVKPFKEEKNLLCISGSTPLLRIVSIKYTGAGLKLFYERAVYRSDEYKYNVRVNV